jgi:hypothetical protein
MNVCPFRTSISLLPNSTLSAVLNRELEIQVTSSLSLRLF